MFIRSEFKAVKSRLQAFPVSTYMYVKPGWELSWRSRCLFGRDRWFPTWPPLREPWMHERNSHWAQECHAARSASQDRSQPAAPHTHTAGCQRRRWSDTWVSPVHKPCQGRTFIFKWVKWGHWLILLQCDSANQSKTSDVVFRFCTEVKVLLSHHTVEILHYKSNQVSATLT